jgi:dipeptidyl aminopeptidase/acylaminoacyl peptidase
LTYWSDGLRVNGFIGFPRAAQSERRPAIIYNRGGAWNTGALIGSEIVPFVESGFVAAATQYRGNGGSEGAETFGSGDVNDVRNLITLLQGLPQVDPARIGMMGGSRGAMVTYMVLRAESLSGQNRIRAAVTVGGISNLFALADQHADWIDALFVPLIGARPNEDYNAYVARSAVYWSDQINTPLLLLHGEADYEVSVDQSTALYQSLVNAGKTVRLVTIPGGDHALTSELGGCPAAVDWFAGYLGINANYSANWDAIHITSQWFYNNRP